MQTGNNDIFPTTFYLTYKIDVSITNGFAFLEKYSWDAYNEGTTLIATVERYRKRTGCYPEKVFADKIYCNRANRKRLKELKIDLAAKTLRTAFEGNGTKPYKTRR